MTMSKPQITLPLWLLGITLLGLLGIAIVYAIDPRWLVIGWWLVVSG